MTSQDDGPSPLADAAGAVGKRATETFQCLANETRLAILLALWDATDPTTESNAVPFTTLRDQVGIQQGAQFNYHLDKLVGRFVAKTDAGYELRRPGRKFVQSIIAGTGIEDPVLDPTEVDADCPLCDGPTAVTYADHYVYHVCTECDGFVEPGEDLPAGTLTAWTFEPTGLAERSAEAVYAASTVKTLSRIGLRFEGICPECSGPVDWSLDVCEDHDPGLDGDCPACGRTHPVLAREACRVCKSSGRGMLAMKTLLHPAVVAFYYDHGIEVGFTGDTDFTDAIRIIDLAMNFEETVVSTDPLRVRVTASCDGDQLHLLVDENVDVLETTRTDREGPPPAR